MKAKKLNETIHVNPSCGDWGQPGLHGEALCPHGEEASLDHCCRAISRESTVLRK